MAGAALSREMFVHPSRRSTTSLTRGTPCTASPRRVAALPVRRLSDFAQPAPHAIIASVSHCGNGNSGNIGGGGGGTTLAVPNARLFARRSAVVAAATALPKLLTLYSLLLADGEDGT